MCLWTCRFQICMDSVYEKLCLTTCVCTNSISYKYSMLLMSRPIGMHSVVCVIEVFALFARARDVYTYACRISLNKSLLRIYSCLIYLPWVNCSEWIVNVCPQTNAGGGMWGVVTAVAYYAKASNYVDPYPLCMYMR